MAGLPWVTLVLLAALAVGGVETLRADRFAAEAALVAPTPAAANRAGEALASPRLVGAVEQEVELEGGFRGDVGLEVVHAQAPAQVVVRATSSDPRLSALAADTALALVLRDHPDVDYAVSRTATVPTDPLRPRTLWWAWLGVVALAGALWVEGAHRVWLRDHPDALAEGAR